jgi:hypothetical protein
VKTYLRKEARRHGSSLQVTDKKIEHDMEGLAGQMGKFNKSAENGLFEDNLESDKSAKA